MEILCGKGLFHLHNTTGPCSQLFFGTSVINTYFNVDTLIQNNIFVVLGHKQVFASVLVCLFWITFCLYQSWYASNLTAFRRGSMFGYNLDLRVVTANSQTGAQHTWAGTVVKPVIQTASAASGRSVCLPSIPDQISEGKPADCRWFGD